MQTASWVIKRKENGVIIAETYNERVVECLNTDYFEAVPILDHLASLNGIKCHRCTQTFRPADQRPYDAEVTRCAEPGCGKRFAHDDKGRCWDV